jgi:hypothetical protein
MRIEEAIGVKETDLDGHVLTLRRVVYEGKVYDLQANERRQIPIMDMELIARLKNWVQDENGSSRVGMGHPSTHAMLVVGS